MIRVIIETLEEFDFFDSIGTRRRQKSSHLGDATTYYDLGDLRNQAGSGDSDSI